MNLSEDQLSFLQNNRSAAMITTGKDGTPKVARVGIALFEGKLWSSANESRVRTARLRRDPRCTLFVFEPAYKWLTLETTVRILEGPQVPELSLRFFRQMQGRPEGNVNWFGRELGGEEFLRVMAEDKRVIYEFDITHAYGMV